MTLIVSSTSLYISVQAGTSSSILDSFYSITDEGREKYSIHREEYVREEIDDYGNIVPDHIRIDFSIASGGATYNDDGYLIETNLKTPTRILLKIPLDYNGRIIVRAPWGPGIQGHMQDFFNPSVGPAILQQNKAYATVDSYEIPDIFYSPNNVKELSKRVFQAGMVLKNFMNELFQPISLMLGFGLSAGGSVAMGLVAEEGGNGQEGQNPYDGILLDSSIGWSVRYQVETVIDAILSGGLSPLNKVPFNIFVQLQNVGFIITELDPKYFEEGGNIFAYDISSRPKNIQIKYDRFELTGNIKTKLMTLIGLRDGFPVAGAVDYYARVADAGKSDQARLYFVKNGNHVFSGIDQLKALAELEVWVEGIEPGTLLNVFASVTGEYVDVENNYQTGYMTDPLGYFYSVFGDGF